MRTSHKALRLCLSPGLLGWSLLGLALSPYFIAHKVRRYLKYRKIDEINPERWLSGIVQHSPEPKLDGPRVALVGASDGELVIMRQIAGALTELRPRVQLAWTLRDAKTISDVRQTHPDWELSYWPFDFFYPVMRYLAEVKPDVMILTERYRFPVLVVGAALSGTHVVLLNSRIKRTPLDRWLLKHVRTVMVRTQQEADWAKEFISANTNLVVTGDIKLELRKAELGAVREKDLEDWLKPDAENALMASGSTDSLAEDKWVMEAFMKARERRPMRLMIAPRRVERRDELAQLAKSLGLKVRVRSGPYGPAVEPGEEDILILDTMGELAVAYKHCKAAYVGGAWDGMGHNVTEPVAWGVPVAYGRRRGHFRALQLLCESHGVGYRVGESGLLADFFVKFANDPVASEDARNRCEALAIEQSGAFRKTVNEVVRVIDLVGADVPVTAPATAASGE